MRADPIQRAIDEDLVRVLYAQDPIAFFSHWFSIAVLVAIYWPNIPSPPLFIACFGFYAAANCGGLALWICNRRYPELVSPRGWIYLHALRGVLLYSAPGIAVWFAFQSPQTDLPLLHTVMLVTLAAGVFMSNGFDLLNFSTAIPFLLFPSIVMHFGTHTFDRTILAIVLAFFFCAINVYALSYRKLFQQVVQARVDQQYLAESLAAQKRVAEEASLAKTRFFAAASHDLRQPLHAIGLLAASLNDAAATPAQHAKTAEHIVYNVEALNQLFNQVLDLARLESGVTQVIRLHFRLSELFERVGSQYRPQAAAKGLALRIAPTTMVVHDDPVLLERVLSNLLSNAVRYTEEGAIWLGVRRAGRPAGGHIEVRDSGIGIPVEEQERIFEEFYQVANPQRDARQGHGLGLPTVKRLVEMLGGKLQLRSAPGRGSVFRFPVQAGDAGGIVASLNEAVAGGPSAQGRRVLCIDARSVDSRRPRQSARPLGLQRARRARRSRRARGTRRRLRARCRAVRLPVGESPHRRAGVDGGAQCARACGARQRGDAAHHGRYGVGGAGGARLAGDSGTPQAGHARAPASHAGDAVAAGRTGQGAGGGCAGTARGPDGKRGGRPAGERRDAGCRERAAKRSRNGGNGGNGRNGIAEPEPAPEHPVRKHAVAERTAKVDT